MYNRSTPPCGIASRALPIRFTMTCLSCSPMQMQRPFVLYRLCTLITLDLIRRGKMLIALSRSPASSIREAFGGACRENPKMLPTTAVTRSSSCLIVARCS